MPQQNHLGPVSQAMFELGFQQSPWLCQQGFK